MKLPKQSQGAETGEKGLTIVKRIVENELRWIFRKNHQENDYGIDAYIDLTTDLRQVTGKSIALQIKTGQSYFLEETTTGWIYRDKIEHLNYYLNHEIPVVILLVDDIKSTVYWCLCDGNKTESAGENWKIVVPSNQLLSVEYKTQLEKHVSPITDYASQLQNLWEQNKMLRDMGRILLVVDRASITIKKYDELTDGLNRLAINPDLIEASKGKIDIGIHGYDSDQRELYEIDEVREWVKLIFKKVEGLAYFLATDKFAMFLRIILYCKVPIYDRGKAFVDGKWKKNVEVDLTKSGSFFDELFINLNTFTEKNNIPIEINKEISFNLIEYLTGEKLSDNQI